MDNPHLNTGYDFLQSVFQGVPCYTLHPALLLLL